MRLEPLYFARMMCALHSNLRLFRELSLMKY